MKADDFVTMLITILNFSAKFTLIIIEIKWKFPNLTTMG